MAELIAAHDWAATGLGPMSDWPQSLQTIVRVMLSSRYAMWMGWGEDLVFLYNDAYRNETLGAKHPWALGKPAREVWAEVWQAAGPRAEKVLRTGEATWDAEMLLFLERNGFAEETYHTFSYSPIPDDAGGIGGMLCVVTEVTERVIGERRLRTLRDLGEANTKEGRTVEAASRISAQILATNTADLPFFLLYLSDDDGEARLAGSGGIPSAISESLQRVTPGENEPWPFSSVMRDKLAVVLEPPAPPPGAGPWPTSQALVLPLARPGQEAPAGFLVAGVSPNLALDDNYHGFLHLLAGSLATAIGNARSFEAEKRRAEALAELDRAKTTFFSNVSHEFRTPLTLLLGPLEDVLATPASDPAERALLELSRRNAQRLLKLVNSLLDFSRIEAGRIQASFEPTDLAALTADLASVFRSAIEKAGLKLTIDCPPLGQPVFVDREMWEKIVLNLISNAFKYTLEGEIRLALREEDGTITLVVEDTGIGVSAEELPKIFDRFHRVEGAGGRTQEGTGIGLALVQELVRIHGGSVTATSQLGKGSTFTATLPTGSSHLPAGHIARPRAGASTAVGSGVYLQEALRWLSDETEAAEPSFEIEAPSRTTAAPDGAGKPLVLVADDNADMRDYLSRLLAPHFRVLAARDGDEAIGLAVAEKPDLVLSDVMMPKVDGFGLLKALREDNRTSSTPFIMLSARAGEEARVEGIEAGADDYLVKPFGARELLARVNGTIALARERQQFAAREHALRSQLESVMGCIGEGFVSYDAAWRINYVNAAALRGLGMTREEMIGRTLWERFPAVAGTPVEDRVRQVMESREPVDFESFYPPLGRWFENNVYPVPDGGIVAYFRDITERRAAMQAVIESEERFRNMADNAPVMVWVTDPRGACTYLNKKWYSFTGQTPANGLGLGWLSAVHEEDRDRSARVFLEANERHQPFQLEYRLRRHDGSYRWAIDAAAPRFDGRGEFCGYIGSVLDIHDVRESEELVGMLKAAVESANDAIIITEATLDAPGPRIEYVNPAFTRMTGYAAEEVIGKSPRILQGERTDPGLLRRLRNDLRTSQSFHGETINYRKDGSEYFVEWRITPIYGADGEVSKWVAIQRDVSTRKVEEERREFLLESERAARTEAERVNRMKDEFLANLSHELRTPINAVLGWTQLLKMGKRSDADIERAIDTIERNARAQVQLIDDLLDMNRIVSGKLKLNVQPLDLPAIVNAAVDSIKPAAEAKLIRVEKIIDPLGGVTISGDPARFQQIFWNLLTNAVKFTPKEGKIQVLVERINSHVEVSIIDTGIGIDAEFLPFVFDRFRQADGSTNRQFGGLGLGLSIVKHLVELHGGRVEARSKGTGKGAAFVVMVPVLAVEPRTPDDRASGATHAWIPGGPAVHLENLRILVVDDEPDAREMVKRVLADEGALVEAVGSVDEAMAKLDEEDFDVLVSDIGMPHKDGYHLIREMRASPRLERIPAVALTAFARSEDRQRLLLAGYQMHIAKPVEVSELLIVIGSLVQRHPKPATRGD
jgi:PAS domain S-box-containing protein